MNFFDRFTDYAPALRCSKTEALGRITTKAFVKDAGFGDCPMQITYEFQDSTGKTVMGMHKGTESSFYSVEIGDQIRIRYLESASTQNAPVDALGIIKPA